MRRQDRSGELQEERSTSYRYLREEGSRERGNRRCKGPEAYMCLVC